MDLFLSIVQIVLSIILVGAILIQHSESGLGAAFGGGDGAPAKVRRGAEKVIFRATIVVAIIFVAVSFLVFVIS
jgi:protein translocase SecG subunit